ALEHVEVEARRARRSARVVAVTAVDVEPGARPLVERAARRIARVGEARPAIARRCADHDAAIDELLELFAAIEVPRLRAERRGPLVVLAVAVLALVLVRDRVVADRTAGDRERRLDAARVVDVRSAAPRVLLVDEQASLELAAVARERLHEDRADRELE